MVCWGLEAVRLHFLVIFYGEPIQRSTVVSPVTLQFLYDVTRTGHVSPGIAPLLSRGVGWVERPKHSEWLWGSLLLSEGVGLMLAAPRAALLLG